MLWSTHMRKNEWVKNAIFIYKWMNTTLQNLTNPKLSEKKNFLMNKPWEVKTFFYVTKEFHDFLRHFDYSLPRGRRCKLRP